MKPRRKYVKQLQSLQSIVEPLPTDRLVWLAKIALDELSSRIQAPQRPSRSGPDEPETKLHPNGRTLR